MASDKAAAAAAFEKGCDFGDPQSCKALTSNQFPQTPYSRAQELLQRACELGDGSSCLSIGFRRHQLSAFQKACERGFTLGCVEVAHFAMCSTDDPEGARAKYLSLLDRACGEGLTRACIARLVTSLPDDAAVPGVVAALQKACAGKYGANACQALLLLKAYAPVSEIHTGEACQGTWSNDARTIAREATAALMGCVSEQTFCGGDADPLTVTLEVGGKGEVTGMHARNEADGIPEPLERCARDVLSSLRFSPVAPSCGPTEIVFSLGADLRVPPSPAQTSTTSSSKRETGLHKEEIAKVIRSHTKEWKTCYQAAFNLNTAPSTVEGKLTTRFNIGPDGRVRAAAIWSSTVDDAILENCILHVVRSMVFPHPREGGFVTVTFPWIMTPNYYLQLSQRAD